LQLPRNDDFVSTLQVLITATSFVTAVLLFGQFSINRTLSLLVLASGYLLSALIVIAHTASFPGAFSRVGLFGGTQTPGWLYHFWHFGFLFSLLAYALLTTGQKHTATSLSVKAQITWANLIVIATACGFIWVAAKADTSLPHLYLDELRHGISFRTLAAVDALLGMIVLLLLWLRRGSILDLWLMVVVCAAMTEPLLTGVFTEARFTVGYYVSRILSVVTSTVVFAVLLSELTRLYVSLSRTIEMLRRERDSKLMNVEAAVATIAHEVRQPLAAVVYNSDAALLFLNKATPDVAEAREALIEINHDGLNASQIFDNIRALFRRADQKQEPADINKIVLDALKTFRGELKEKGVTAHTNLTSKLPPIVGHSGQLLEVIHNLIQNAIDAIASTNERPRVLRITTERRGLESIAVSVEDSGFGVAPEKIETVFDAFVTTKSRGIGMGLAICKMIVERHGGEISAASDGKTGALFQLTLPINLHEQFKTEGQINHAYLRWRSEAV
jgi:signal transduction histidine kinase